MYIYYIYTGFSLLGGEGAGGSPTPNSQKFAIFLPLRKILPSRLPTINFLPPPTSYRYWENPDI